jgi:hypothetical protein
MDSTNKKFWEEIIVYFPLIRHEASNNSSIVACVSVAVVAFFLLSRCLVTIGGCRHTDRWEGFMKQAVEMGSGAIISIPSFWHSKVDRVDSQTHK